MTYISVAVRYDSERRFEKRSSKGIQDPWEMHPVSPEKSAPQSGGF